MKDESNHDNIELKKRDQLLKAIIVGKGIIGDFVDRNHPAPNL